MGNIRLLPVHCFNLPSKHWDENIIGINLSKECC